MCVSVRMCAYACVRAHKNVCEIMSGASQAGGDCWAIWS